VSAHPFVPGVWRVDLSDRYGAGGGIYLAAEPEDHTILISAGTGLAVPAFELTQAQALELIVDLADAIQESQ
jgi:hypothetical protein